SKPSPSLSRISHRITWDAVHLPHLDSPRQEGNDRRQILLVPLRAGLESTSRG
ncbi:hypothetical protein BD311DRAFT_654648, partial [Dichomitus squalens]